MVGCHDRGDTFELSAAGARLVLTRSPLSLRLLRDDALILESGPGFGTGRVDDHEVRATGVARARCEATTLYATCATSRPDLSIELTVTAEPDGFALRWQAPSGGPLAEWGDAYRLVSSGEWFGGGGLRDQPWPLSRGRLVADPFGPEDLPPRPLLGVQTPFWLTSRGVGILADDGVRLRHSLNDGDGCWRLKALGSDHFSYRILVGRDAPSVHGAFVSRVGHPAHVPPGLLFERPIWTTWTRYKTRATQATILDFAREIVAHGYPRSVLEIDDRWQVCYGDSEFDPGKFPDPGGMVRGLHDLGFAVTLWVMPFVSRQAARFGEARARGFLVRDPDGAPAVVRWWQGRAALLDVSNPEALAWFADGLTELQSRFDVDGFKFDAGEASFFPRRGLTHGGIDGNEYTRRYVDFVGARFPLSEVRAAWFNQAAPVLVRQFDKASRWDTRNGLRTLIPQALTFSLTGYPFILPDIIGGNQYLADRASAELLIRWTQVTALLPTMQFSLAPWDYGPRADALCRDYARLHTEFAPTILDLAAATARTGEPIIRPVFWAEPGAAAAYGVDDEFLLGDRYLVAPVVQRGAKERDVYLPAGTWADHWTGRSFDGPATLTRYPAPLERLLLFERDAD